MRLNNSDVFFGVVGVASILLIGWFSFGEILVPDKPAPIKQEKIKPVPSQPVKAKKVVQQTKRPKSRPKSIKNKPLKGVVYDPKKNRLRKIVRLEIEPDIISCPADYYEWYVYCPLTGTDVWIDDFDVVCR